MKCIRLATHNNKLYAPLLIQEGYQVEELSPSQNLISSDKNQNKDVTVLQLEDCAALPELPQRGKIIILAENLSDSTREALLHQGIVDLLTPGDPKRLALYIKTVEVSEENSGSHKIMIMESAPTIKRAFEGILPRFGHEPLFVHSTEALFDNLRQPGLELILFNLGIPNLDLNDFIRRSYGRSDMRSIPLIAYKDMDEGLYVNEVISGLNRLTKFILSPDELYSFLVELLFRREFMPIVLNLQSMVHLEDHLTFAKENLTQIYHNHRDELFSLPEILNSENMDALFASVRQQKKALIKAEGLRWLRKGDVSQSVNTCGFGG